MGGYPTGEDKAFSGTTAVTSLKADLELQGHSGSSNDADDQTIRHRIAVVEEDETIEQLQR